MGLMKKIMTSTGLQFYEKPKPVENTLDENILNLIPKEPPKKPKRYTGYISGFRPSVIAEKKKVQSAWKTMGHALEPLANPNCHLKKGCGVPRPIHCVTKHRHDPALLKPPIPKDPPLMNLKRETDFIKTNAAEAILLKSCPNAFKRGFIDEKTGHFENLRGNNLEKKYVYKPCYGKVPKYLLRRYRDQYDAENAHHRYNGEFLVHGTSKMLCEEEKQALLWGLKHNWEDVNKEYIRALKACETNVQQRYKEQLEKELDFIKKDIDLLERNQFVYVPRDEEKPNPTPNV